LGVGCVPESRFAKQKFAAEVRTETRQKTTPLETLRNPALARSGGAFRLKKVSNKIYILQMISVAKKGKHP
jgi:hypothetical protein